MRCSFTTLAGWSIFLADGIASMFGCRDAGAGNARERTFAIAAMCDLQTSTPWHQASSTLVTESARGKCEPSHSPAKTRPTRAGIMLDAARSASVHADELRWHGFPAVRVINH